MKKTTFIIVCLSIFSFGFSQTVPKDSLYLGQSLPGSEPKVFKLEVSPEYFAAERIAISNDGTEIYYTELNGYDSTSHSRIKYYKYSDNKWEGPFVLFESYAAPSLSPTNDTLFMEKNYNSFYSVRNINKWSEPKQMLLNINSSHYLQVTNNGNFYVSALIENNTGLNDWCKLEIKNKDTSVVSLGLPLSCSYGNLDFYMDNNENFCLTSYPVIGICYPDEKGNWTNPRTLGDKINFGVSGGAFISADNKYLFYTTFLNADNSDTFIYWVSIDNLIDSLKNTNLPPYVNNKPNTQNAAVGEKFSFTVPKDAICDEDGKKITYEALLLDGSPLPEWLTFDAKKRKLAGIPLQAGDVVLRINGYDDKNEMTAFRFTITVLDK